MKTIIWDVLKNLLVDPFRKRNNYIILDIYSYYIIIYWNNTISSDDNNSIIYDDCIIGLNDKHNFSVSNRVNAYYRTHNHKSILKFRYFFNSCPKSDEISRNARFVSIGL